MWKPYFLQNCSNRNVTLQNKCLPVARRGEKYICIAFIAWYDHSTFRLCAFLCLRVKFFQIGKRTMWNKNLQCLFPLIRILFCKNKTKTDWKNSTTHEAVDLRQMQFLGVERVLETKEQQCLGNGRGSVISLGLKVFFQNLMHGALCYTRGAQDVKDQIG